MSLLEGSHVEGVLTHGKVTLFVLFRPLTDWMRLNDDREGNLLYSIDTNFNVTHKDAEYGLTNVWDPVTLSS